MHRADRRGVPGSELAAEAEAAGLWQTHLAGRRSSDDALAELLDYAERYPESPLAVPMLAKYAQSQRTAGRRDDAIATYRAAIERLGDTHDVKLLHWRLGALAKQEQVRLASHMAAQQEKAERLAHLRAMLGGHDTGYFVLYAQEKPPRNSKAIVHWVQYDTAICNGLEAAAAFIDGLPDGWRWELKGHYPNTPEGARQAGERHSEIRRR